MLTSTEIEETVRDADLVVLAVTSEGAEWVSEETAKHPPEGVPVLVLTKGLIEHEDGILPVALPVQEIFGRDRPVVGVGGPVKASDLIRGFPTQTVFATESRDQARKLSAAFSTPYYFPGTTDDLLGLGLGLCAALKNCYAIAFGSLTGNDARPNLRALTFGTALGEICTTVTAAGGRPETVAGAAGAGDLYVTCLSGRNGDFGCLLGEGNSPNEAREKMSGSTVEGLGTLPPALALARSLGLDEEDLPLLHHLDGVLQGRRKARDSALADLMPQ